MSLADALAMLPRARITGTGSALPARIVPNEELTRLVETTDDWIHTRTGIRMRHVVSMTAPDSPERPATAGTDLAERAARQALLAARVEPGSLGAVIVATCTPDYPGFPATAAVLGKRLGAPQAFGYDISLACTGFIAALMNAERMIRTGACERALVVGVEIMSRIVDWKDRNTCVIFADGAGAAVLERSPGGPEGERARGAILYSTLGMQGDEDALYVDPQTRLTHMKGRETYKFAVQRFVSEIEGAAKAAGRTPRELDVIVPHQVNRRIIEAACERLDVPLERVVMNIERVGNTSAASVPLALDEAAREGRLREGALVCLVAFGAGLSWGSALVRW